VEAFELTFATELAGSSWDILEQVRSIDLLSESSHTLFVSLDLIPLNNENSEFCFPEALNVPRGEDRERQNSMFPEGSVVTLYLPTQKWKKLRKNDLLDACGGCAVRAALKAPQIELSYRTTR